MGMVWSPDGQDLAFTVKRFRNSSAKGEIWRVRRDGSGATAITGPDVEAAGMPDFGATRYRAYSDLPAPRCASSGKISRGLLHTTSLRC